MTDLPSDTEAQDQNQVRPDKNPTRFLDLGHPDSPAPYPTYAQAGQAETHYAKQALDHAADNLAMTQTYAQGSKRAAAESARLTGNDQLHTEAQILRAILAELKAIRGLLAEQAAPVVLPTDPETD